MKILVIQLARLSDTLQSLMALRAAQQLYPEIEIHILVRERFADAARRIPWIKGVHILPTEKLITRHMSGNQSELEAIGGIARWLQPLVQEAWDLVLNWTYSEASSYLATLIPAKFRLGFTRQQDMSLGAKDGWSSYIQGVVHSGIPQNIHLTDIYTTQLLTALQIHLGDPVNPGNATVSSSAFFTLEVQEENLTHLYSSRKWVGLQIDNTWSIENWVKISEWILRRHAEINLVLLADPAVRTRAEEIMRSLKDKDVEISRVLNLAGRTDFDLWASVVSRCGWIISGPSAAVHLASVLGTRVLHITKKEDSRWDETGPYGNGHYVISSEATITPEQIYAIWSYGSSEWAHQNKKSISEHFSQLGWSEHLREIKIYRSKVRPAQDGGGVVYAPMNLEQITPNDWFASVVGQIARSWYCGWVAPIGAELRREHLSPQLVRELRKLEEASDILVRVSEQAQKSATELAGLGQKLKSEKVMAIEDRKEIDRLGHKLIEYDGLIERLGKSVDLLRIFSQMSKVMLHNLPERNLTHVAQESAQVYGQMLEGVRLLKTWVKHTLDLARPVAIAPSKIVPISGKPRDLTT